MADVGHSWHGAVTNNCNKARCLGFGGGGHLKFIPFNRRQSADQIDVLYLYYLHFLQEWICEIMTQLKINF